MQLQDAWELTVWSLQPRARRQIEPHTYGQQNLGGGGTKVLSEAKLSTTAGESFVPRQSRSSGLIHKYFLQGSATC